MKLVSEHIQLSATDLSNHLYCHHLTELNRLVAEGFLKKPYRNDPALEVLAQRGREHEEAYIEHLKKKGLTTISLSGKSIMETTEAMAQGIDVLVQARLESYQWLGLSDIL